MQQPSLELLKALAFLLNFIFSDKNFRLSEIVKSIEPAGRFQETSLCLSAQCIQVFVCACPSGTFTDPVNTIRIL